MSRLTDLIWPTLERPAAPEVDQIRQSEDADIAAVRQGGWQQEAELALDEARRLIDSEEDRRRTAESKATTYILFAGALIPLLTYLETSVWEGKTGTAPKYLSMSLLLIAVLYLIAAGVWAFRAISVGVFHRLDVPDLVKIWIGSNPKEDLIRETLIVARQNRDGVNEKVSRVIMANSFIKRAFILFGMLIAFEAAWEIAVSLPFKLDIKIEKVAPGKDQPQPGGNPTQ